VLSEESVRWREEADDLNAVALALRGPLYHPEARQPLRPPRTRIFLFFSHIYISNFFTFGLKDITAISASSFFFFDLKSYRDL